MRGSGGSLDAAAQARVCCCWAGGEEAKDACTEACMQRMAARRTKDAAAGQGGRRGCDGWRRWCWRESQLIGASGGGGRLRWRREEPERTSSGGAGGAAAAGTCAAWGPVPCGPARLSRRPEPAQSHQGCHSVGFNCDFASSGHADACSSTEARRAGPDHWLRPDARACCAMTRPIRSVAHVRAERKGALPPSAWQGGSADARCAACSTSFSPSSSSHHVHARYTPHCG